MYAIATVDHVDSRGLKTMRILNCPDRDLEGGGWLSEQNVETGRHYLVRFEPQDQFCKVVDLRNVAERKPGPKTRPDVRPEG